jgi:hypothetical protein
VLQWAARAGKEEFLHALLKAGLSPDSMDPFGRTPLHWASGAGQLGSCYYFLLRVYWKQLLIRQPRKMGVILLPDFWNRCCAFAAEGGSESERREAAGTTARRCMRAYGSVFLFCCSIQACKAHKRNEQSFALAF